MIRDIKIDNREEIVLHLDSIGLPDTYLYKDIDEHTTIITQGSNDFLLDICQKSITDKGITFINEENQSLFIPQEVLEIISNYL
jgi:hypothetical protein